MIEPGSASSPTVSIGTSESPASSDPCEPPPRVVPPGEVGELPAGGRGDDQLAGVRVRERRPGALEPVRVVEDRGVAARPVRREPKLLAVPARDRLVALAVEDDLDGRVAVEPARERSPGRRRE